MANWVLAPLALDELAAILDYVAEESGSDAVAEKVQGDFLSAFDDLAATPGMGKVRAEWTGPTVRWWLIHRYWILYDPGSTPLRILRIVHGAREIPRWLHSK